MDRADIQRGTAATILTVTLALTSSVTIAQGQAPTGEPSEDAREFEFVRVIAEGVDIVDEPGGQVVGEAAAHASCSSLLGDIPNTVVVSGEPTLAAAYRVTGRQLGQYIKNKPRNLDLKPREFLDMCIFDGDFITTTSGPAGVDKSAVRVLVIVAGPDHRFLLRVAEDESGIPLENPSAEGEDDLLSRLVTEEIEPGVHRLLSDGFRELSPATEGYVFKGVGKGWGILARSHEYRSIVTARDGSVWVFEPDRFFRIGKQKERGWDGLPGFSYDDDFAVSPAGTAWRVAGRRFSPEQAWSFDGKKWTRHKSPRHVRGVEIEPDGTVWTTWWRPFGADSIVPDKLARWNGKRWTTVDLPRAHGSLGSGFTVAGKDSVWFCCTAKSWTKPQDLLRYDGRRWKTIDDPVPPNKCLARRSSSMASMMGSCGCDGARRCWPDTTTGAGPCSSRATGIPSWTGSSRDRRVPAWQP